MGERKSPAPLSLTRGNAEAIRQLKSKDGQLLFSLDTKEIYLDYAKDGKNAERIKFGGSTGIWYGHKEEGADNADVIFTLDELESKNGTEEYPNPMDLILNKDGSFFKVEQVDINTGEIVATRLTVAGGGGTGGGGYASIQAQKVNNQSLYFSASDNHMMLPILIKSDAEDDVTRITATVRFIGNMNKEYTLELEDIGQSWDAKHPVELDIKSLIDGHYKLGSLHKVYVQIGDTAGNRALRSQEYSICVVNMSVGARFTSVGVKTAADNSYTCVPTFHSSIENVHIVYEIKDAIYNKVAYQRDLGELESAASQQDYSISIDSNLIPSSGSYIITTWLEGQMPGTTKTITSNKLSQNFIWLSEAASNPIVAVTFPEGNELSQYQIATIEYLFAYVGKDVPVTWTVNHTDTRGNVTTTSQNLTQQPSTIYTWSVPIRKQGAYEFVLQVGANKNNALSSTVYTVTKADSDSPTTLLSSLALNFIADKNKDATDKTSWQSTKDNDYQKEVSAILENFNWENNGWVVDEDGTTGLLLNNGAKVTIPYSPFSPKEPTEQGLTIELDVKISNIKDYKKELITCLSHANMSKADEKGQEVRYWGIQSGIAVNGDFFTINSKTKQPIVSYADNHGFIQDVLAGMSATYAENERIRVTFVLDAALPKNTTTYLYHEDYPKDVSKAIEVTQAGIKTYVNGVISGYVPYNDDKFIESIEESAKFVFDSTYADIEIYNLRVYNAALSNESILGNYFASFTDLNEARQRWADNQILEADKYGRQQISLQSVLAKKNIPVFLFRGGLSCDKKGKVTVSTTENQNTPALTTDKKDYRLCLSAFYDPEDESKSWGSLGTMKGRKLVTLYLQGTSSKDYPIKNERMKFVAPAKGEVCPYITPDDKYAIYDEYMPVNLFCLKADYMESSSSHNTGLGNLVDGLYDELGSEAMLPMHAMDFEDGIKRVSAIKGRPCVAFWRPDDVDLRTLDEDSDDDWSQYQFIGRYNFNYDKATPELFGFEGIKDKHYGMAVLNPPKVDRDYAANLKKCELIDGWQAVCGKPTSIQTDKYYYLEPDDNAEKVLGSTLVTSDGEWSDSAIARPHYEKIIAAEATDEHYLNSIQVWEFKENGGDLTSFTSSYDEKADRENEYALWLFNFESRFPEYEKEPMADKRDWTAAINWVNSTIPGHYVKEYAYEDDGVTPIGYEKEKLILIESGENAGLYKGPDTLDEEGKVVKKGRIYRKDSGEDHWHTFVKGEIPQTQYVSKTSWQDYDDKEKRLAKFKKEFTEYFDLNLTLFYYIITEVLLLTDSRAKNMMMATFTANCKTSDGKSATRWFPIFYDMDTQLGVNNQGDLEFTYKVEDTTSGVFNAVAAYTTPEGSAAVGMSAFWANFVTVFRSQIDTFYKDMRKTLSFNPKQIITAYNDKLAQKWNETFYNQDANLKYINPVQLGYDGKIMTTACQGTRSYHRQQFLTRRFNYLDSKHAYLANDHYLDTRIGALTDNRPEELANYNLYQLHNVKVKDAMYFVVKIGTDNVVKRSERIEEGSTIPVIDYSISNTSSTATSNQPFYIYFTDNILDYGDFYTATWEQTVFNGTAAVKNFQLGYNAPGFDKALISKKASSLDTKNCPKLEELSIAYYPIVSLDLSTNTNLKKLNAYGTSLTSCIFPEGGILEELELPATLSELTFKNQAYLDSKKITRRPYATSTSTLGAHTWAGLSSLSVEQCPLIDTKAIVQAVNQDYLKINLPDVNWTFTKDEVVVQNNVLVNIPLLDLVLKMSTIGSLDNTSEGRTYFGGTVTIENTDFGIDEVDLYNRYNKYYPNINFVYNTNEPHNKFGYTVNVYDTGDQLRATKKYTEDNKQDLTLTSLLQIAVPIDDSITQSTTERFIGWTHRGFAIAESDLQERKNNPNLSYAEAYKLADKNARSVLALEYKSDEKKYVEANGFSIASVFANTASRELNLHPVFVGQVRTYTARFLDEDKRVLDSQQVYYGEYAEDPVTRTKNPIPKPIKIEVDKEDQTKAYGYPFVRFGKEGQSYQINSDTDFQVVYGTASSLPNEQFTIPEQYLSINTENGVATLRSTYPYKAACFPNKVGNTTIKAIGTENNFRKVSRYYFLKDNEIIQVRANFHSNARLNVQSDEQMEYFDLAALTKLKFIGNFAFGSNKIAKFTQMSDTVVSIGTGAFSNCRKLESIRMPASLLELGNMAFYQCQQLTEVDFTHVDTKAQTQQVVDVDNNVIALQFTTIPESCFNNCINLVLTKNSLPSSVTKIEGTAFLGCAKLQLNFTTLPGLQYIGNQAFDGCIELGAGRSISSSLNYLGSRALANIRNMQLHTIAAPGLKNIFANTFADCVWAADEATGGKASLDLSGCINLQEGNTGIDASAFTGVSTLYAIILPTGRTDLEQRPYASAGLWSSNGIIAQYK